MKVRHNTIKKNQHGHYLNSSQSESEIYIENIFPRGYCVMDYNEHLAIINTKNHDFGIWPWIIVQNIGLQ